MKRDPEPLRAHLLNCEISWGVKTTCLKHNMLIRQSGLHFQSNDTRLWCDGCLAEGLRAGTVKFADEAKVRERLAATAEGLTAEDRIEHAFLKFMVEAHDSQGREAAAQLKAAIDYLRSTGELDPLREMFALPRDAEPVPEVSGREPARRRRRKDEPSGS